MRLYNYETLLDQKENICIRNYMDGYYKGLKVVDNQTENFLGHIKWPTFTKLDAEGKLKEVDETAFYIEYDVV